MIPFHRYLLQRANRMKLSIGNHRYAAGSGSIACDAAGIRRHRHHFAHARQPRSRRSVEPRHFAAQRGAHPDGGVHHARQLHVQGVNRRAMNLGRVIHPPYWLPNQPELRRVLQLHVLRQFHFSGLCGQFAEGGALPRRMQHPALPGRAFRARNFPVRRRGRDQRRSRPGPGLAHRQPEIGHAGRSARSHQPRYFPDDLPHHPLRQSFAGFAGVPKRQAIRNFRLVVINLSLRGLFQLYLVPRRVHFIGQQHRQTGVNPLAQFGLRHHHRHCIIGGNFHPAVQRHLPRRHR